MSPNKDDLWAQYHTARKIVERLEGALVRARIGERRAWEALYGRMQRG